MAWEVEVSNEFVLGYDTLDEEESVSVDTSVDMLVEYGPMLGAPTLIRSRARGIPT